MELVEEYKDGLLLDCGSGKRSISYENVVNYEIVSCDTTDVIGVAEELPFIDNAFDAVISVAVLEHFRDPFRAAKEITAGSEARGKAVLLRAIAPALPWISESLLQHDPCGTGQLVP